MTERKLGFHPNGCVARAPYGIYAGFACCAQQGHDGMHAITNGSADPPHYVVVFEWPATEETDEVASPG